MSGQEPTDELQVLRVVADFFRKEGRGYYPNVGDVARATGKSDEDVARIIGSLEAQELITAHRLKPGSIMITSVTRQGMDSVGS
ncbi:hypothetical protein BX265_6767 [Streptomyces sp. TLI_235]|nr:hypothetical protein [Streptomyces sp. TLI_235]PBC72148.1 hypothetical protein BX265_6767 [Streptomyces sp. TLI_235]